VSEEMEKMVA
jgi:centromere protein J